MEALRYPPHLTLAIYEEIEPAQLWEAYDSVSSGLIRLSVRFEELRHVDAPHTIVLWAEPVLPDEIAKIHTELHVQVGSDLCRPNYRPGAWIPHCTLATAIDRSRRDEAIARTQAKIEPFEVVFDVIDCVHFYSVEVLHERAVPSAT
jgi:2'-5' RNA ligase